MKQINRFIKLYNNDDIPYIMDIDKIEYYISGELYSHKENESGYYTCCHSVEKVQQIIEDSGYDCSFLYLHTEDNLPILVNSDYIHSISKPNIGTYTNIWIGSNCLNIVETIDNIYKKLTEIKKNKNINKTGNVGSVKNEHLLPKNTVNSSAIGITKKQQQSSMKIQLKVIK